MTDIDNYVYSMMSITWGVIVEIIKPIRPAHWPAENLDIARPTPTLPPRAIAAANGSHAVAISWPYFKTDSETAFATPDKSFFLSFRYPPLNHTYNNE